MGGKGVGVAMTCGECRGVWGGGLCQGWGPWGWALHVGALWGFLFGEGDHSLQPGQAEICQVVYLHRWEVGPGVTSCVCVCALSLPLRGPPSVGVLHHWGPQWWDH